MHISINKLGHLFFIQDELVYQKIDLDEEKRKVASKLDDTPVNFGDAVLVTVLF